jgi:hypothetical protein
MAHKMGAGSTKNTRDSQSQRLGVKCFGKTNNKLKKICQNVEKKFASTVFEFEQNDAIKVEKSAQGRLDQKSDRFQ